MTKRVKAEDNRALSAVCRAQQTCRAGCTAPALTGIGWVEVLNAGAAALYRPHLQVLDRTPNKERGVSRLGRELCCKGRSRRAADRPHRCSTGLPAFCLPAAQAQLPQSLALPQER